MLTNGRVGPASLVASSSFGIVLCGLPRVLDLRRTSHQDAKGKCVKLWSSRSTSDGCVGTGKSAGIRADSGSRLIASSRRFSSSAISLEVLSLASYSFNLSHRISLEPQTGALSSFNRFFKSLTFEVGPRSTGLSAAPPAAGSSSSSALASGGTTPGWASSASGACSIPSGRSSSGLKSCGPSSNSGGSSSASKPLAWTHPSNWMTLTLPPLRE